MSDGLVGARFGMLTVLAEGLRTSPNADHRRGKPAVLVVCDCGVRKVYERADLREQSQCGAHRVPTAPRRDYSHVPEPVVGDEQGRWTVVKTGLRRPPIRSNPAGVRALLARCACGTEKLVASARWRRGDMAPSCGCHHKVHHGPSVMRAMPGVPRFQMHIEQDGSVQVHDGLLIGLCQCAVPRPLPVWAIVSASDALGRIEIDPHVFYVELPCACLLVHRLTVVDHATEVSYRMWLVHLRHARPTMFGMPSAFPDLSEFEEPELAYG
jgi:hypothetical protein